MKHTGGLAASLAVVLTRLAVIAASLTGSLLVRGVEVPFTEHVISVAAEEAFSVFATDVDGDGDTDVLSASQFDDKITWLFSSAMKSQTVSSSSVPNYHCPLVVTISVWSTQQTLKPRHILVT